MKLLKIKFMKAKKLFLLVSILILNFTNGQAQNKSLGAIDVTIPIDLPPSTTEVFRFLPGLVTQIDKGAGFGFTGTNQWFALGNLTPSFTSQTLYGFRVQRAGRGLTFGYSGANESSGITAAGNPFIQWIGNNDPLQPSTISQGNLEFRTSASSSTAAADRLSLTLRSNLSALLGETTTVVASGIVPKLEINASGFGLQTGILVDASGGSGGAQLRSGVFKALATSGGTLISTAIETFSGGSFLENFGLKLSTGNRGATNTGVFSEVSAFNTVAGSPTNSLSYGLRSRVTSATATQLVSNYGVYSEVFTGNASSINCGVFATTFGNINSTNGILGTYAGYFGGTVYATQGLFGSDKKLKKDIVTEANILEKIALLNPVNYKFNDENKDLRLNLPTETQHGFIAQELELIFPELVKDVLHPSFNDKNEQIGIKTLKAVNYTGMISILAQSVKELVNQVKVLQSKLDKNENARLNIKDSEVLSSSKNYFLGQNTPNPFTNTTEIEYELPNFDNSAFLLILNLNGQTISEYKLTAKKGLVTINSNSLQKGLYLYSLILNGQELDTKKMILN